MMIELDESNARRLRDLLHDYLPVLRREAARADDHDLRHELVLRQELVEKLVEQLDRITATG